MIISHTPNTTLVISLAEAKEQLRLESDFTNEDALITSYIKAATLHAQHYTNRFFIDTEVKAYLDAFPSSAIKLYKGNVTLISAIKYKDSNHIEQTWSSSNYYTDLISMPGRILPKEDAEYPSDDGSINNVELTYKVGWSDAASVPEDIKIALKLIVSKMYAERENSIYRLPTLAEHFLNPFRLNYL